MLSIDPDRELNIFMWKWFYTIFAASGANGPLECLDFQCINMPDTDTDLESEIC